MRRPLAGLWHLCSTAPGLAEAPDDLEQHAPVWISCERISTVADLLQRAGSWSLDGPARRFDAEDWWFRTEFESASSRGSLILGLDGLATLADVWLNGSHILHSENMFLAHEIDISSLEQPRNELVICCRSLDNALKKRRPRPRWKAPMVENQQLRWHRTTLLGRTPGWSPPCAPVGPWRPIWIEISEAGERMVTPEVRAYLDATGAWIELTGKLSSWVDSGYDHVEAVNGTRTHRLKIDAGKACQRLKIEDVRLWWPHTHGEPTLYDLSLTGPAGRHRMRAVGFREVRLVTEDGTFGVRINGVRVFCRGACWTPPDVVGLQAGADLYERLIGLAADAGLNMLRVSGPMVYEADAFFEVCDRLGIMVWQDFMFANMDYPAEDAEFAKSVTAEVEQQLARLAPHPAVCVVCGNSETAQQAAMSGADRSLWQPDLFHMLIPGLVKASNIPAPYWPSSASGGSFPHQPDAGTSSYYGVGAYLLPIEDARRSAVRFASEALAFANVPDRASLSRIPGGLSSAVHHPGWKSRVPRDLTAGWDFDDVRDFYLSQLFGADPMRLRYSDHARYLELSRITSGEMIAAAFSEWRRQGSVCNGALILFLKDLWHGAGWGLIDAAGDPKAALYCARDALRAQTVVITNEGCNGLAFHVINDRPSALSGTLRVTFVRYAATPTRITREVVVPAFDIQVVRSGALQDYFVDVNHTYRFGPPTYQAVVADLLDGSGEMQARACFFPQGHALTVLDDLGLEARSLIDESGATLELSTQEFAQNIAIDLDGHVPEAQYFHLLPGEKRRLRLHARGAASKITGSVKPLNCRAAQPIKTS